MDRANKRRRHSCGVIAIIALLAASCADDPYATVPVTGTVTLDGAPLADAMVTFTPTNGNRSSWGITNDEGRYMLRYSMQKEGALPGTHEVDIRTDYQPLDAEGIWRPDPSRERVPAQYNENTNLTAEVSKNNSEIDFDLTSQ